MSFDRDPFSGRETVFANIRGRRPHTESEHDCPFCPGNERLLEEIVRQLDGAEMWRTRIVANRYPIVAPPLGRHDVVVETPQHRLSSAEMTVENWRDLVTTWRARFHTLAMEWRYVTLYRNAGRNAGETIGHLHSHLLAMSHVPVAVQSQRRRLRRAFHRTGRCLVCDRLDRALRDGARVVASSPEFAVIVPRVPEVSYEVRIVPRRHDSVFAGGDKESDSLARALHDLMRRMYAVLGRFDHNMMLECADVVDRPHLHWFLRLRPRLEFGGGFEMVTGMSVNASDPAADAAALRRAAVPDGRQDPP